MEQQQTQQLGPGDLLIEEYKAQMSLVMHSALESQTNFRIALSRIAALEKQLAEAAARIVELEAGEGEHWRKEAAE